jgi:GNAT superfamily N-acetyltransferase
MNVIIRKGEKKDLPGVLALIHELAEFEKAPDAVTNTVADMERDGFGEKPVFRFHIAESGGKIVGIAVYFVKYSTWKGKGFYLDDIVVTENFRSQGIGKKLFDEYVKEAKKENAKQLHWQVLDWNKKAIKFYERLNARIEPEWWDCKLDEEEIREYK